VYSGRLVPLQDDQSLLTLIPGYKNGMPSP
jgi:hypothetical protein